MFITAPRLTGASDILPAEGGHQRSDDEDVDGDHQDGPEREAAQAA
jgi:hypothetical protein